MINKNKKGISLGIAGATGLVGRTMIKVLEEKKVSIRHLELYASKRSVSEKINCFGKEYNFIDIDTTDFKSVDYVLFALDEKIALPYIEKALKANCLVIDNSSLFRMREDIPLVTSDVNLEIIKKKDMLIANPNCSTLTVIPLLDILDHEYGIDSINYTTYQAVSGSGIKGIKDLMDTKKNMKPCFYKYPISETCIPLIGSILDNGYSTEEEKMINETKKILRNSDIAISATCVRVPVMNCHGVVVRVKLKKNFKLNEVKKAFQKRKNIVLLDNEHLPNSVIAKNSDLIYVGRLRSDLSSDNSILFYVVADNLRRGAATNAVEILLELVRQRG